MNNPWANPPLQKSIRGMSASPTVAINERSDQLRREGRHVYKMGLGQSPFPVPMSVVEALRANAWRKDYLPVRGLPALREAVADYYRRRQGSHTGAEDVLIGPGSKELMFLLQVVFDGELLLPTPAWVSYAPQAKILNRRVLLSDTSAREHWRLMPSQLEAHCKQAPETARVLILNYPSNPTSCTYGDDELGALAEVARRYRVIVLSDEIYGELHFAGKHSSIVKHYPEGTVISSGLSKWCGAGGWRLGTFLFARPLRWLLDAMAVVASETFTTTSAPIQFAAVRAFEGGAVIEHYLAQSRKILAPLARGAYAHLRRTGLAVAEPEGGFYLFPDASELREVLRRRGIQNSRSLCERLLDETGVAVLPGEDFGRPAQELSFRVALVNFDGARALSAVEQMPPEMPVGEAFLKMYCSETLEAIERISAWFGEISTSIYAS